MIKPSDNEVFGKWLSTWGSYFKLVGFRIGRKTFIESTLSDGTSRTKEYLVRKVAGKPVLVYGEGIDFGEYFVINFKGDLEFWGADGNFYTAKKIQ